MEDLVPYIITTLYQYGYLILFLGAVFAGEVFILAASFLAYLGYFEIGWVIVISLVGILLSDSFWYFVGSRYNGLISQYSRSLCPRRWHGFLDRIKDNFKNHFKKFLILSKFVYGIRILTILLAGHQKLSYHQFFIYNFFANICWLIVVVAIGLAVGFSWDYLSEVDSYLRYSIIAIIVLWLFMRWIISKILKKFY